jgi:hypothetical protein
MTTPATVKWAIATVVIATVGEILALSVLAGGAAQASCQGQGATPVSASGEPPLVQIYIAAAKRYGLGAEGYAYLGSINDQESSFGTDMATSPPQPAEGWMAFTPETWSEYGLAIGHAGNPDPFNPYDAIYSAARYLKASGAPGDWATAVFAYNHAGWYVAQVTAREQTYAGPNGLTALSDAISQEWGGRQPTGTSGKPLTTPVDDDPQSTPVSTGGCCQGISIPTSSTQTTDTTSTSATQTTGRQPEKHPPRRRSRATSTSSTASGQTVTEPTPAGCGSGNLVLDIQPVPGKVAVIMPGSSGIARPPVQAPPQVQAMIDAGDRILHFDYQYAGGHADPAASDSQTDPHPEGGQGPGDNGFPGYDCSGSTAYVLAGGGVLQSVSGIDPTSSTGWIPASGTMESWGQPGPGRWVTWYADSGHVYIEVAGIYLDTAAGIGRPPNPPSTGPRWVPGPSNGAMSPDSDAPDPEPFVPRHPQGL